MGYVGVLRNMRQMWLYLPFRHMYAGTIVKCETDLFSFTGVTCAMHAKSDSKLRRQGINQIIAIR